MTVDEANEIISKWYELSDMDCSCHLHPPCSKCVDCPTQEQYEAAINYLNMGDQKE